MKKSLWVIFAVTLVCILVFSACGKKDGTNGNTNSEGDDIMKYTDVVNSMIDLEARMLFVRCGNC